MCGRFTLFVSWREIHDLLAGFVTELKNSTIEQIEHAPARYNVAPTQPILVFVRTGEKIKPELMRWGLIPEWVDSPKDFPLIINARAETLAEKTSFKNALKNQRCIIPANGYYEWKKNEDGSKTPTYISRKDGKPFLLAGLYSMWVGPDGEEVDTAAIITFSAQSELRKVHHRTPVSLEGEAIDQWLNTAEINASNAHNLLHAIPNGVANFHQVSTKVNAVRNDDDSLIEPVFEQTSSGYVPPKKPKQLDLF